MKNIYEMNRLPANFWVVLKHVSGDMYSCVDIAVKYRGTFWDV